MKKVTFVLVEDDQTGSPLTQRKRFTNQSFKISRRDIE